MTVSRLEEISNKRIKVYLEETFAFVLYDRDIRTYHISEGSTIDSDKLEHIYQETILRRAKQKAMRLLVRMDYSEYSLRQRLKKDLYPDRAIDDTVAFLYTYHYLDDARYTQQYMLAKASSSSYAQMRRYLLARGIESDMIEHTYKQLAVDEKTVLYREMRKKLMGRHTLDEKEKKRTIAYFMRRGFSYQSILECMDMVLSSACE